MDQADIAASPKLRLTFAVGAAVMLALWGWGLWPLIENWNNPNEDGFSAVPAVFGTIFCLPPGLLLLAGAIVNRGGAVSRARKALYAGGAVVLVVIAFLILQYADEKFHLGIG